MRYRPQLPRRQGTTIVEAAIVYPVTFLFLLGLLVGGMGMFRYQQVAALAREGTRWAAVRGTGYAQQTGYSAAAGTDVYNNAIQPRMVSLDPTKFSYSMSPATVGAPGSTLSLTVTYTWMPEVFLVGPITLTSTSTVTVAN